MEISQGALAWLSLCALILGCALGAVYDALRISRIFLGVHYSRRATKYIQGIRLPLLKNRVKKEKKRMLGIVVFVEDLFFCVFCGIALILLFYECNNGKIRYPVIPIVGAGFLLYRGTLGKLVMLFSEVIAFAIGTALRYVSFFLLFPMRFVCKQIRTGVLLLSAHFAASRRKRGRIRYTEWMILQSKQNACGLIPENLPKESRVERRKKLGKQQKTIQSHAAHSHPSGNADRGFDRFIRVQRDAVQRFDGRKSGAGNATD